MAATATSNADIDITCKDCHQQFVYTKVEADNAELRGHRPFVRCVDCRKSKRARYEAAGGDDSKRPKFDMATEAKLDAWVTAKRNKAYEEADKLRAALRADGVDTEAARPVGYVIKKVKSSVKCFNCGSKGHRSEACVKLGGGNKGCYHCGSLDHVGRDCPKAPAPTPFDPSKARCYACGEMGHIAGTAACSAKEKVSKDACHICGESGHIRRYCPKAKKKSLALEATESADVQAKLQAWAAARQAKDYERADCLRAELLAVGVNPNKQPPKS